MKPGPKRRDPVARFIESVSPEPNSGCWLWMGPTQVSGHAQFCSGGHQGKKVMAYRFAYENMVGPIPDGLFVCHRCDVPQCVNPDHMFLDTQKDNMQDAAQKGRAGVDPKPFCGICGGEWHVQPNGAKVCKPCQRAASKRSYHRVKERDPDAFRAAMSIKNQKRYLRRKEADGRSGTCR